MNFLKSISRLAQVLCWAFRIYLRNSIHVSCSPRDEKWRVRCSSQVDIHSSYYRNLRFVEATRGLREGPLIATDADAHQIVSMTSQFPSRHMFVFCSLFSCLQTCSDSNHILPAYKSYRTHGLKRKVITRPTLHSVRNSLSVVDSAGLSRTYPRQKVKIEELMKHWRDETQQFRNYSIIQIFSVLQIYVIQPSSEPVTVQ